MTFATNDIFIRGDLAKPHGAARMHFLRGNSDLTAKTKFTAISESRGGVYVNGGRVHRKSERIGSSTVLGYDRLAMSRGMRGNAPMWVAVTPC